MFFLVAYGKKSLEEILFKLLLRKKYCVLKDYLPNKPLNKISTRISDLYKL